MFSSSSASLVLWLIPLLPFAGFVVNGLFSLVPSWRGERVASTPAGRRGIVSLVGVGVMVLAFALTIALAMQLGGDDTAIDSTLGVWMHAGSFSVDWALRVDRLSVLMMLVITGVGSLIHIYSVGYMADDAGFARYFAYLNLFVGFMLMLVMGANLPVLFIGWEGVGLASYLLIGFWFGDTANAVAGKKAFVVNRIGDFGLLLAMFILFANIGSLDFAEIARQHAVLSTPLVTAICLFMFLGCAGKSAQLPLYVWLPDAMAGPTPVSALIHAATMVTAGIYLIVRNATLFSAAPVACLVIVLVGALTALWAATVGLKQLDIKKVLAYSTISQLGYMFVAVGAGAYTAAMFHLVTHAFFKALLFLGAGAVIHGMHHALHATHRHDDAQDMRNMGGLMRRMPATGTLMWIATLAIAGIPPLAGFFSKDAILSAIAERAMESPLAESSLGPVPGRVVLWFAYALAVVTAFLTAIYMTRLMRYSFHGTFRSGADVEAEVHDAPWMLRGPLVALGALTLIGGWLQLPEVLPVGRTGLLETWLAPITGSATTLLAGTGHLAHNTEYLLIGIAVAVAVAGIATAFVLLKPASLTTKDAAPAETGIGLVLANDYFVDAAIERGVVGPTVAASRKVLWRGLDLGLINGVLVQGSAQLFRVISSIASRAQVGFAGSYVWAIALGAVALIGVFTMRGGQ
ncbi:MAG: NADH-quinone oxidoreductase subunit L [Gemmatimonadaceae bacterium]|nr:NADH-quinone oxidoreductase subunit L [Gemmatimonadaceae bacterium]